MDDLTAARERHQLGSQWTDGINPTQKFCRCGDPWPCDFALAIEALDESNKMLDATLSREMRAHSVNLSLMARERSARALADELAEALEMMRTRETTFGIREDDDFIAAALAKWEASK